MGQMGQKLIRQCPVYQRHVSWHLAVQARSFGAVTGKTGLSCLLVQLDINCHGLNCEMI